MKLQPKVGLPLHLLAVAPDQQVQLEEAAVHPKSGATHRNWMPRHVCHRPHPQGDQGPAHQTTLRIGHPTIGNSLPPNSPPWQQTSRQPSACKKAEKHHALPCKQVPRTL